jgi:cytochrome P450
MAIRQQVGQQPKLDLVFKKNPVKLLLGRLGFLNSTMPQVKFAQQRFAERMQEMGPASSQETKPKPGGPRDFLTRFLEAKKSHADVIGDPQVLSLTMTNLVAGSDTTAISLRTIFYYLLKTPECYRKLMQQISGGEKDGLFADTKDGLVSWAEAQKLAYLDAVVKEGLRIFPAVGFCLERVVPAQGAEICGETIPGGCIVGCNAWVIHRREEIYGEDVDVFRPERWLEADEERLAMMKRYMFSFGMGSHTCIGKNVSYLEMYKVVPAILRRFTVSESLLWCDS